MLPFFFHDATLTEGAELILEESAARHIVQVLRMRESERLLLTDGRGATAEAVITEARKKSCLVALQSVSQASPKFPGLHLCIAFTKNASRNEWLLEKAVELGVQRITPLITARGEKIHARPERWRGILISAMLQSQQAFLPELSALQSLEAALRATDGDAQKLLAHCIPDHPRRPLSTVLQKGQNASLFIGPEGDFTPEEISLAEAAGCTSVSLGNTRLRTETAALAACALFHLVNDETS